MKHLLIQRDVLNRFSSLETKFVFQWKITCISMYISKHVIDTQRTFFIYFFSQRKKFHRETLKTRYVSQRRKLGAHVERRWAFTGVQCDAEGEGGCTWCSRGRGEERREGVRNEQRNILISAKVAWCILGEQKLHRKPRPGEPIAYPQGRFERDQSCFVREHEHVYPQQRNLTERAMMIARPTTSYSFRCSRWSAGTLKIALEIENDAQSCRCRASWPRRTARKSRAQMFAFHQVCFYVAEPSCAIRFQQFSSSFHDHHGWDDRWWKLGNLFNYVYKTELYIDFTSYYW